MMAWNTCKGDGQGREVVLPHPPCYRSHGTDLFDILVLLCTCLVEWNANLICKPLGLFEGNHLLFWVIILIPHCIAGQGVGPVHASGGGASACIRGWDQCMHQGVGPVHASGGGTSACIRGWDQCMHQGVGPVHTSGGGASACIRGWGQCMHQGVGAVHASGGGASACIRGWDQCMEQTRGGVMRACHGAL